MRSRIKAVNAATSSFDFIAAVSVVSILSNLLYRVNRDVVPEHASASAHMPICARPPCPSTQDTQLIRLDNAAASTPSFRDIEPLAESMQNAGHRGHLDTCGLGHRGMRRHPRHRATTGAQRTSQPFGHTTANLASGGVCSTARFNRRPIQIMVVRTVHRHRPVLWVLAVPAPVLQSYRRPTR